MSLAALAALYAEFDAEDRSLAAEGMFDYAAGLLSAGGRAPTPDLTYR